MAMKLKQIAFVTLATSIVLSLAIPAQAQSTANESLIQSGGGVRNLLESRAILRVQKKVIKPVIAGLSLRSDGDSALRALLGRLKTSAEVDFLKPPNARAFLDGSQEWIHLDIRFVAEQNTKAQIIAIDWVGSKPTKAIVAKYQAAWRKAVAKAKRQGNPTPYFLLPYWKFINDPVERLRVELLSEKVNREFMAYIILHEIGHHVLGHTKLRKTSPKRSQELESDADMWALRKLCLLDYSIYGVHLVQKELAKEEDYFDTLSFTSNARGRTHPLWSQRALVSAGGCAAKQAKHPLILHRAIYGLRSSETGQNELIELYILFVRNPEIWATSVAAVVDGGSARFGAVEIKNGSARIFVRSEGKVFTYTLRQPSDVFSDLEFGTIALESGARGSKGSTWTFQDGFSFLYTKESPAGNLYEIMNTSPMTYAKRAIRQQMLSTSATLKAENIVNESMKGSARLWLRFMKGELSSANFQQALDTHKQQERNSLERIFGTNRYQRYLAAYLGQKTITNLIALGLKQAADTPRIKTRESSPLVRSGGPRTYRSVSQKISHFEMRELVKRFGFFDRLVNPRGTGVVNDFQAQTIGGQRVVVDRASSLMWQQSGSTTSMTLKQARAWVTALNASRYAGFWDWRLPTTEEAMTLVERGFGEHYLYISDVFEKRQSEIWLGDYNEHFKLEGSLFGWAINFRVGQFDLAENGRNKKFARAVRSK